MESQDGLTELEKPPTRSLDIQIDAAELITIDLDNLDPNPDDYIDLLVEGKCKGGIWATLASEYWRRDLYDQTYKMAQQALTGTHCLRTRCRRLTGAVMPTTLRQVDEVTHWQEYDSPRLHFLLANVAIAQSRKAPKMILADARELRRRV